MPYDLATLEQLDHAFFALKQQCNDKTLAMGYIEELLVLFAESRRLINTHHVYEQNINKSNILTLYTNFLNYINLELARANVDYIPKNSYEFLGQAAELVNAINDFVMQPSALSVANLLNSTQDEPGASSSSSSMQRGPTLFGSRNTSTTSAAPLVFIPFSPQKDISQTKREANVEAFNDIIEYIWTGNELKNHFLAERNPYNLTSYIWKMLQVCDALVQEYKFNQPSNIYQVTRICSAKDWLKETNHAKHSPELAEAFGQLTAYCKKLLDPDNKGLVYKNLDFKLEHLRSLAQNLVKAEEVAAKNQQGPIPTRTQEEAQQMQEYCSRFNLGQ